MENNEAMNIRVGIKLVACHPYFYQEYEQCTTVGKVYEVIKANIKDEQFFIIDDSGDKLIFDFSDVPNVWFNFYKTKKDPIVKQVTDKFKARSKVGIEKYGTTLEENNTDDFLTHLEEEMMDSLLYLQKIKSQRQSYNVLVVKHNELISQFEKLQKKDVSSYATSELIKELIKRNYSVTG